MIARASARPSDMGTPVMTLRPASGASLADGKRRARIPVRRVTNLTDCSRVSRKFPGATFGAAGTTSSRKAEPLALGQSVNGPDDEGRQRPELGS
jgi:hypothetical protein